MPAAIGVSQQVLDLEHLFGAPLQAIVNAHEVLARSTLQFLSDLGFEARQDEKPAGGPSTAAPPSKVDSLPRLRMLEFTYTHPVPHPDTPGVVVDVPTYVRVPLLAMLSLPSLRISDVTLDYNVRVVGTPAAPRGPSPEVLPAVPIRIKGVFAPRTTPAETSDGEPATLSVHMRIVKEGLPEAASRVMTLLQDATVSYPLKELQTGGKTSVGTGDHA